MQFHLDGYRPGDPEVRPAEPACEARAGSRAKPAAAQVPAVGTGPAGLDLAEQLVEFPGITTTVVERRGGPFELGQADGVACRAGEMFNAFGLAANPVREGYGADEATSWGPDSQQLRWSSAGCPDVLGRQPEVKVAVMEFHDPDVELGALDASSCSVRATYISTRRWRRTR